MERDDIIIGVNAVTQALRGGRPIDQVLVSVKAPGGALAVLLAQCRETGIVIKQTDSRRLDELCEGAAHQGVLAMAAAHRYAEVAELLALAKERGEFPLLILCDALEDPHNLGAILRTADAAGAHGVIIPKRRSVSLNYTVAKTSAGALEYVGVARVTNMAAAMLDLKRQGIWIYGADQEGVPYTQQDFSGPLALVIGAEGRGLSRVVREKCDFLVSLPMKGQINSLNASVAAGILLYEIAQYREKGSMASQ